MAEHENIPPETLKAEMDAGRVILIDVREPHEYGAERIPGALNLPLSTFDVQALPVDAARAVVLHCAVGGRSGRALDQCAAAGVAVTAHLAGGINGWKDAGLPVLMVDPVSGAVSSR